MVHWLYQTSIVAVGVAVAWFVVTLVYDSADTIAGWYDKARAALRRKGDPK